MDTKNPFTEYIPPVELVDSTWRWPRYEEYYWGHLTDKARPRNPFCDLEKWGPILRTSGDITWTTPLAEGPNASPSKENSVMYKIFASLDGSPDSFIAFAKKYGSLGSVEGLSSTIESWTTYEHYAFWLCEHWLLRAANLLWDWIRTNDLQALAKVIRNIDSFDSNWEYTLGDLPVVDRFLAGELNFDYEYPVHAKPFSFRIQVCFDHSHDATLLMHGTLSMYSAGRFVYPTRTKEAAMLFLINIINAQFSRLRTGPIAVYNDKQDCIEQRWLPSSLLAAMWFQFFQVVTGEKVIKQCPICLKWSDVTHIKDSWKKHRECANWDRVTRLRKLPAVQKLIAQGQSIEDIAAEINIEPRHIKKWLSDAEVN